MKYVKILGLLAVAAAALMAFAGSASATSITSPTGTSLATGSTIHAESEESAVAGTKHVLLHNAIAQIKCNSTVNFTYDHKSATGTATGAVDHLTFTNCTDEWVVDVEKNGSLEVHWTSGYNGTLTSTGAKVTATRGALQCIYETSSTDIGEITGGSPATLHIKAAIPRTGGSFLCGSGSANWTGSYVTTNAYYIDS